MAIHKFVKKAIFAAIASPRHWVPEFPMLTGEEWDPLHEDPQLPGYSSPREDLLFIGKKMLDTGVAVALFEELAGKPSGFGKCVTSCIIADDILKSVMEKIEPRIIHNVDTVSEGFEAFLGAVWLKSGKDTTLVTEWVVSLIQPLARAASPAYVEYVRSQPPRPDTRGQSNLKPKKAGMKQTKPPQKPPRLSSASQLLKNLERLQRNGYAPPRSPPTGSSPHATPSPPLSGYPFLFSPTVPCPANDLAPLLTTSPLKSMLAGWGQPEWHSHRSREIDPILSETVYSATLALLTSGPYIA
ncbi:hypothetical protein FB451DRAFT_480010 [Mycena latifolia]|nr:hypothetical protein FB451DRAFT_480010 [Mycena latifolia]